MVGYIESKGKPKWETPDWNDEDTKNCEEFVELEKQGKITYEKIV